MWLFSSKRDGERQTPSIRELHEDCLLLAKAERGDTRQFACLFSGMNLRYYADVLSQARDSFLFALAASATGVAFFIFAAWQIYKQDRSGWIGLIAGGLLQIISGTALYLYGKASAQFATFHICLDRANRFVLANTISEALGHGVRDDTRAYLVRAITDATLLTDDVVSGVRSMPAHESSPKSRRDDSMSQTQPTSA